MLAMSIAVAFGAAQKAASRVVTIQELTVPSESSTLVVVYGLRFAGDQDAVDFWRSARASHDPKAVGVVIGPMVAVASGEGQCFQAVEAYLKALIN